KLHRRPAVMQGCTDVEDLAAVFLKLSECSATHVKCTFEIDVDDCAETIRRELFRSTKKVSGGAVDHDVDLAEAIEGGRNCPGNMVGFAEGGSNRECFSGHGLPTRFLDARFIDCRGSWFETLDIATYKRDICAGLSERGGNATGDTGSTASNKGNPAFQD